ncbi:phosphatidylinositol-specific phospholipase C domain-containing protein [Pseudomonas xanthosomatis]|uniref:phosphatidylinositol-specific phospholipase C domain-containing protein n=1 Tax=Pseudomonas xanthosomatis TaxID=2842356 RepID=UPI001CEDE271|nr:phosphatidylinositol-specific phospholipase C domain-containing protein [Pseudomonas xanthosomatis]
MQLLHPVLGMLGLFYALASPAFAHSDDAYSHDAKDAFTDKSAWMSAIRDNVRLSELALAGTHDSATFDTSVFPIVDDIVRTQTLNFDEQLKYGIRVLDLRIRRTGDAFALHHGPVYLDKMFGNALQSIERFLKANPSETVLFRIKEEHTAASDATIAWRRSSTVTWSSSRACSSSRPQATSHSARRAGSSCCCPISPNSTPWG